MRKTAGVCALGAAAWLVLDADAGITGGVSTVALIR